MTFLIIYYNALQYSHRNMPCSDDTTLENAIKTHWKPQLSNRKFLVSSEVKMPPPSQKEVGQRSVGQVNVPPLCH